jgi:hypothetical protein
MSRVGRWTTPRCGAAQGGVEAPHSKAGCARKMSKLQGAESNHRGGALVAPATSGQGLSSAGRPTLHVFFESRKASYLSPG